MLRSPSQIISRQVIQKKITVNQMSSESDFCTYHANKVDRICLDKDCFDRLMCLLCEHDHGGFKSILVKTSQSYKRFKGIVNEGIDFFLERQETSDQAKVQNIQIELIEEYYVSLQRNMIQFISEMKVKTMETLKSNHNDMIDQIKKTRFSGDHAKVPPELFRMFMEVYEGFTFEDLIKSDAQVHCENAQDFMANIHVGLKKIMDENRFRSRVNLPDLRTVVISKAVQEKRMVFQTGDQYIEDNVKVSLATRVKLESTTEFNSIVSDAIMLKDHVFATSYDKTLKIFDRNLNFLSEVVYENILMNIAEVDSEENIFAIAQSKELLIQKIDVQSKFEAKRMMKLRGHTERINDIHAFNTRIIGSSSDEGTKIWDLYKEKCEYTFKDEANPTAFNFIPKIATVVIGYNNHTIKSYSIETLKMVRKWGFGGLPLCMSQERLSENIFYVGGFPSNFAVVDIRLKKLALDLNFESEAITCFSELIYEESSMLIGQRAGLARLFDLRKTQTKHTWEAHTGKTNMSKPNGIVQIFEDCQGCYLTIGANDRKLKIWEVKDQ